MASPEPPADVKSSTSPEAPPGTSATSNTPLDHTQDGETNSPQRASVSARGASVNPRSCVTCRRRKVKCDKLHPCSNCKRAQIECVYPSRERAPRKLRKPGESRDKELLERLRRLEGVVKNLGAEVAEGTDDKEGISEGGNADTGDSGNGVTAEQSADDAFAAKTRSIDANHSRFENRFGRLVMDEGKSRYINNSFWASLSNEVEDLKGILNQSSEDDDDEVNSPLPGFHGQGTRSHQGFVFAFSSHSLDLFYFHPPPEQIDAYWSIYKDRVDPLCKVLHIPTLEPTVLSAASHLTNLSKGFEALLFTIYYGAITSSQEHDCMFQFGEEKSVLLARYRFAIEQALARANFLTTEESVVLQAFVVFLICLRRNSHARVIWTLTGLVVRIAQTLGIHRDGSHFGIPPFEIEMRRRLWWQVCLLDIRASEDHGCDPTITEQSFDTKMPLNINDGDMHPDMKDFPTERLGCTDMSFCLIRFEMSNAFRRISYVPPGHDPKLAITLEDKQRWITECHERLAERYLKHCDMSVPLYWVTATVARLMMSKVWLMVYHPFHRMGGGAALSPEIRDKLFITSLENLEYSFLLQTEPRTMKWGWLFKTYMQWHALAFMLSELCHRTTGHLVERAWRAVERSRGGTMNGEVKINTSHLWRPLKRLYQKARDARQRGLQEEQIAVHPHAGTSPPARTYSPNANPMFGHASRPRLTRAPLSQAQLQRFVDGPTFGQAPFDKHELLSSPSGSDSRDTPDTDGIAANIHRPLPDGAGPNEMMPSGTVGATTAHDLNMTGAPAIGLPGTLSAGMVAGQGGMNETTGFDFNDFFPTVSTVPNGTSVSQFDQPHPPSDDPIPMDALLSSAGLDLSDSAAIMDTSADLYWESWDQLVRQAAMDVDSGAGSSEDGGGNHPVPGSWNGGSDGQLPVSTSNWRMGLGMSGSDWF